jgi:hypothetical protein
VLRDRGVDCLSTQQAGNLGCSDSDQLAFATSQERVILTFNVRDFVRRAQEYTAAGSHHGGIIVSDHLPFRELLRRVLALIQRHPHEAFTDRLLWLQDYKTPAAS